MDATEVIYNVLPHYETSWKDYFADAKRIHRDTRSFFALDSELGYITIPGFGNLNGLTNFKAKKFPSDSYRPRNENKYFL